MSSGAIATGMPYLQLDARPDRPRHPAGRGRRRPERADLPLPGQPRPLRHRRRPGAAHRGRPREPDAPQQRPARHGAAARPAHPADRQRERHRRDARDPLRRQRPARRAGRASSSAPTCSCCSATSTRSTRGRRTSRARAAIDHVAFDDDLAGVEFGDIGAAGVGTGGAGTKVAAARLAAALGNGRAPHVDRERRPRRSPARRSAPGSTRSGEPSRLARARRGLRARSRPRRRHRFDLARGMSGTASTGASAAAQNASG